MNFDWTYFWESLLLPSPRFLSGLALTVIISVVSMALALVLGLLVALMGRSRFLPLRLLSAFYVWIIRGTPLLVQLVIIYTGLAAAGLFRFEDVDLVGALIRGAVQAAIVGLMLNESAYISEIVRSGLESVDRGQNEAALSLGMTPTASMRKIIVPQAIRIMVPPLGNSFNGLMKSTSILSVIGVAEMFQVGSTMSSATFKVFEVYLVVAIYYLALTTVWTFIQTGIENALNTRAGLPRAESVWKRLFGLRSRRQRAVTAPAPVLQTTDAA
ncbi:amino acid ABC transporter membrane protein (PAAT family) [Labedella gwakjiensis]|uniref:Amino acid ABC transporter membrane protein (PAAT family) n=1 Tax=Labedella gwakjiensis TaxID=390269 RepID=A0A2P8GTT7_9MICO|nr:amino acid ABC transporter permease [Labedella gwakjiensis]PSL37388.1 amino acid ABC transporter membrane protein (PAAT family) [Labedella gwakjiensis]RUQ84707.1 amino acid ABC transporter permease [Labedella gwakjiensis]